jgi:outer membrane protein
MKIYVNLIITFFVVAFSTQAKSVSDSLLRQATLQNCIQYALTHQPSMQESMLDEEITEDAIQEKLADWFPQLNLSFNMQHNPQLPVAIVQGVPIYQGLANNANIQLNAMQNLFNRDVLLASTSANNVRLLSKQNTQSAGIDVVVNVSKAYYAVLVTKDQIEILDEAIVRLEQSYKDAFTKYQGGIVDKTDYKRAQLALNNAMADRKQAMELLNARLANLRELMGYPKDCTLDLVYDKTQMEHETFIDTTQPFSYNNRIEYQLLQTRKLLQQNNLDYYEWGFIPSISLYGGYTFNYQNSFIDPLFNQSYRISFVGLQVSFPLFQGGKRIQQIDQAKLQIDRLDDDILGLENALNTQLSSALANYKSNLNYYKVLSDNLQLAQDVYQTIQLQYKAGTKSYLEFITAETDLRTSQVNQTNALYQLLVSKLDVQKALGTISY